VSDARVEKLAQVLVQYSMSIRCNDRVYVQGSSLAEPLLKAILVEVLKAGGHPHVRAQLPGAEELFYRYASDDQLQHVAPATRLLYETYDAMISIWSAANTRELTNVPPQKLVLAQQSSRELFRTFTQRTAAGELHWVGTLFPTTAFAQDAEMGLAEYEDFVYNACLPDSADPVGHWQRLSTWQQTLVDWLKGRETLRVEAPEVDLRMRISGRTFVNCDGKRNMPDGEIFTGPVEDSVEGHVRFSYPTVYQGRRLDGVHVCFKNGRSRKQRPTGARAFSCGLWMQTRGLATSVSSPSGRTRELRAQRATRCSARRSAAASTWPSGPECPRRGVATSRPSTGTWCATSCRAVGSGSMTN